MTSTSGCAIRYFSLSILVWIWRQRRRSVKSTSVYEVQFVLPWGLTLNWRSVSRCSAFRTPTSSLPKPLWADICARGGHWKCQIKVTTYCWVAWRKKNDGVHLFSTQKAVAMETLARCCMLCPLEGGKTPDITSWRPCQSSLITLKCNCFWATYSNEYIMNRYFQDQ